MKYCSTCKKTFSDQNLSYCLDDGTPLVPIGDDVDEVTQVRAEAKSDWGAQSYQPPSYVPPGGDQKRRSWPWIVGIVSFLFIVLLGGTAAAVMLLPRLIKESSPIVSNSNANNDADKNVPENKNSNSD